MNLTVDQVLSGCEAAGASGAKMSEATWEHLKKQCIPSHDSNVVLWGIAAYIDDKIPDGDYVPCRFYKRVSQDLEVSQR